MTETPGTTAETPFIGQADFEKITQMVSAEFQTEEALVEYNLPTFYLKQPQETKQAFLRLLKNLNALNLIALLRRIDGKVVLKILPKPSTKPSNVLVNWALFFATIATTFITGYLLSLEFVDRKAISSPLIGGAIFTLAIMAVFGTHEMAHKLTANKNGIDATPPYFIPGPPPIGGFLGVGTFGAVILQKSLPPNKDSLFDIGSSGPLVGFVFAAIVSIIGLMLSPIVPITGNEIPIPFPLFFDLFASFIMRVPADSSVLLHPIAFAGWVGMIVTMLNLLPVAMLDGGHAARAMLGEKARLVLSVLSIAFLVVGEFWSMAILVLLMSTYRHPGPLDDVSGLSRSRKLMAIGLIVVFVFSSYVHYFILALIGLFGG